MGRRVSWGRGGVRWTAPVCSKFFFAVGGIIFRDANGNQNESFNIESIQIKKIVYVKDFDIIMVGCLLYIVVLDEISLKVYRLDLDLVNSPETFVADEQSRRTSKKNLMVYPCAEFGLRENGLPINVEQLSQILLTKKADDALTCVVLEIPNIMYSFKVKICDPWTQTQRVEEIIFERCLEAMDLFLIKTVQFSRGELFCLEQNRISLYNIAAQQCTVKFEYFDNEDSIKFLLFCGEFEIILTMSGKILTLKNWSLLEEDSVKNCAKIYGAAISANSCCLCLMTCNKLCQILESELKIFSGYKFLNLDLLVKNLNDSSKEQFDWIGQILKYYKKNVFALGNSYIEPSDIILLVKANFGMDFLTIIIKNMLNRDMRNNDKRFKK